MQNSLAEADKLGFKSISIPGAPLGPHVNVQNVNESDLFVYYYNIQKELMC